MRASPGLLSFNAGELSPAVEGRTDLKQYQQGCYKLENFIPMVQGPIRRRPGTKYLGEVKDSPNRTALMEFVRSTSNAFVLEWGHFYVRFWQNYVPVTIQLPAFSWNVTPGGTTNDGGVVVWTNKGANPWSSGTPALGTLILDSNGNIQQVSGVFGTGVNGATAPTFWETVVGNFTADPPLHLPGSPNGVQWTCLGKPIWLASHAYLAGAVVIDSNGAIEIVTTPGTSSAPGPSIPYEIVSPYPVGSLFDVDNFFQLVIVPSADVLYITHRSKTFPAYKLSHFSTTNWTLEPVDFIDGPFQATNPGNNPVVYASDQTGRVTLTASANIFDPLLVGSFFQLTQNNIRKIRPWETGKPILNIGARRRFNGVTYEALNNSTGGPPAAPVTGDVPPTHLSGQAYDGSGTTGILWRYMDNGTGYVRIVSVGGTPTGLAANIVGITAAKPPVVTMDSAPTFTNGDLIFITGVVGMTEVNDTFYKVAAIAGNTFHLTQDDTDGAGGGPNVDGSTWDAYLGGGTVDNRLWTATADVVVQDKSGTVNRLPLAVVDYEQATQLWAYGQYNDRDGYPNACSFFAGRLAFARDGQVDISVASDFENFALLTPGGEQTADMAISVTLPTQDAVQWLAEGRVLVVGTSSAEHVIEAINQGQAVGQGNIAARAQLRHGSRPIRPLLIGHSLLFTQTSGQKVRVMKYQFYEDQYESQDVLHIANHMFEKYGPTQLAFQQEPDTVVWFIRGDGALIGFTFNEEDSVLAWHRHPLVGEVEAVACIPNPNQNQDDLWLIIHRIINGQDRRYVEVLQPHFLTGDSLATDAFYSDSGTTYSGAPTSTITGLGHLELEIVKVLTDGAVHPDRTVVSGQITLQWPASHVQVGEPQTCKVTTMPLEAGAAGGNTAQGKTKRITSATFRFLNTLGGQAGIEDPDAELTNPPDTVMEDLEFRDPINPMSAAVPIYNGLWPKETYDFNWPAGYEAEGRLTYKNSLPLPVTIAGIYPTLDSED